MPVTLRKLSHLYTRNSIDLFNTSDFRSSLSTVINILWKIKNSADICHTRWAWCGYFMAFCKGERANINRTAVMAIPRVGILVFPLLPDISLFFLCSPMLTRAEVTWVVIWLNLWWCPAISFSQKTCLVILYSFAYLLCCWSFTEKT